MIMDQAITPPSKSENFQIRPLGDRYVVMMPPQWLVKPKKSPRLSFSVSRNGILLSHQLLHIFEGVYALQLQKDEAFGALKIKVWTDAKPPLDESFEVDLGSSWWNAASWRKATRMITQSVQSDAFRIQQSLSPASQRAIARPLMSLRKIRDLLRRQKLQMRALKRVVGTTDLAIPRMRDLTRHMSSKLYRSALISMMQMKSLSEAIQQEMLDCHVKITARRLPLRKDRLQRYFSTWMKKVKSIPNERFASIRGLQKTALKSWWRVRGTPDHRIRSRDLGGKHKRRSR